MPMLLKRAWNRSLRVARLPAGLGGAFLGLTLFQLNPGSNRLAGLVVGWLYGISVWGLMRVFPIGPRWTWLAGILAGPIPFALLMPTDTPAAERSVILLGCLAGGLLGLLEVACSGRAPGGRSREGTSLPEPP